MVCSECDHEGELEYDAHTSTTRSRRSFDNEDLMITGACSVSSHSVSSSYQDSPVVKKDSKDNSSVAVNSSECEMNTNLQNGDERTSGPSIPDRDVPGRTVDRNDSVDRELCVDTHRREVIEGEVVYGGDEETASIGTRAEKSDSDIRCTGNEPISHHSSNGISDHSAVYDSDDKSQEQNDVSRQSTTIEMPASREHSNIEHKPTVEVDESSRAVARYRNMIDFELVWHQLVSFGRIYWI